MTRVVVLADDLTGANAVAALLREQGLRSAVCLDCEPSEELAASFDAIAVCTDTREVSPEEAYSRVRLATRSVRQPELLCKRIDSTLRGNLGAELEAVLAERGDGWMAVVTPAFPASARTVIDGHLFLHSRPVGELSGATDLPSTSHVPSLLALQTRHRVRHIPLQTVRGGAAGIAEALRSCHSEGTRIVSVDAETEEDIGTIAAGMLQSQLRLVPADPGPLTAALVRLTGPGPATSRPAVLLVSGSLTELARMQVDLAERLLGGSFVSIHGPDLLDASLAAEDETARAVRALVQAGSRVAGIRVAPAPEQAAELLGHAERLGLQRQQLVDRVCEALGRVARGVIDDTSGEIGGVFMMGGAVSSAVLKALGARAIEVHGEVLPLAAWGVLVGGPHAGLPVVTKGGLVGDETAVVRCLEHLRSLVSIVGTRSLASPQ